MALRRKAKKTRLFLATLRENGFAAVDVTLLIEVSDSSLANDLQEKADVYAESGVAEYWVMDVPASRIHVMTKSDGKHFRSIEIVVPPNPLSPKCRPEAILNTAELFEVQGPTSLGLRCPG
jgi:Uma2 family endonuclease